MQTIKKAGMAIEIKKTPLPFATGIYSTDGVAIAIRLKTGNSIKNIAILNPYAAIYRIPNRSNKKYWGYIGAYISLIPNNQVKIWRADNNGQLCRNGTNSKYIGKWPLGKKMGNINRNNLGKSCGNNVWVASNNYHIPQKTINHTLPHGPIAMARSRDN